jgi:transcriptional regulator with XRE-family HTH domain
MSTETAANRIKELREARGLSAAELGKRAGMSQPQVSRLENSNRRLKVEQVVALAKALGVSTQEIISGDPDTAGDGDAHLMREMGDRLVQAREALGLSQEEFASMHGVPIADLDNWEQGRRYPDPQFIVAIWKRHRINSDWIYLGEIAGLPHSLGESLRAGAQAGGAAPPAAANNRPAKIHESN